MKNARKQKLVELLIKLIKEKEKIGERFTLFFLEEKGGSEMKAGAIENEREYDEERRIKREWMLQTIAFDFLF